MNGAMWMFGGATVVFAGVVAYALTRRYNWGVAVMVPFLALIAMFGMRWQAEEMSLPEGLGQLGPMLLFASPILLGSVLGILIARLRPS